MQGAMWLEELRFCAENCLKMPGTFPKVDLCVFEKI
jgi:hypothetical protein